MVTWKIVGASKVLVLYIYIDYTLFKRIQNERGWQQIRISKSEGISHKKKSYCLWCLLWQNRYFTYFTRRLDFFSFQEMREPSTPTNSSFSSFLQLLLSSSYTFHLNSNITNNKEVKSKVCYFTPFFMN